MIKDFIMDHTFFSLITLSLLLDMVLGDPRSRWHPVACIGRFAAVAEQIFRRPGKCVFLSGIAACLTVCLFFCGLALAIYFLAEFLWGYIGGFTAAVCLIYITVAARSLAEHVNAVRRRLADNDLPAARTALSMIVSRQTEDLPESEIVRGALESLGENMIDAVFSAIFWAAAGFYLTGGTMAGAVFFAVLLRVVNTLDACWGYRNEQYLLFGRCAARMDDLLHWLPARISVLLISLAGIFWGCMPWKTLYFTWCHRKDHPSPNSCWGMVPYAVILQVKLGGTTVYDSSDVQYYPRWDGGDRKMDAKVLWHGILLSFITLLIGWLMIFFLL